MSRESILKTKSFDFAVRIIKLYKFLKKDTVNTNCHNKWSDPELRLEP